MSIRRYPIVCAEFKKDHERCCDQSMQLILCGGRVSSEQLSVGQRLISTHPVTMFRVEDVALVPSLSPLFFDSV